MCDPNHLGGFVIGLVLGSLIVWVLERLIIWIFFRRTK